ncbi:MAG: hypothetical protein ACPGXK_07520 [Phycisphaerae bacterium]
MTNPSSMDNPVPVNTDATYEGIPMGDHPLEIAARRGIGPLSQLASENWHGQAKPCVSCGLLVMRDQRQCDHCGQDLSDGMMEKMKAHAGPWYVLEHLRPFPGVSLERIVRQINRGVLTETSIIRGPATDFQWRFAVETPGICRHFGKCWKCHCDVGSNDLHCQRCLAYLEWADGAAAPTGPRVAVAPTNEGGGVLSNAAPAGIAPTYTPPAEPAVAGPRNSNLQALSSALGHANAKRREQNLDDPPRVGGIRAIWIAIVIIAAFVAVLVYLSGVRSG